MPRMLNNGAVVDEDQIFDTFDDITFPINSTHSTDERIHLRAKAPRPCTILALVPSVQTNDKV
jgi:hypothetical protein